MANTHKVNYIFTYLVYAQHLQGFCIMQANMEKK